ncbi:MAG TPA: hypothetical protein VGQ59_14185, partial [Cyclobacteriaceae bacterium]|nr:hypothetical protein [Cyclobacteriaceae bacterium]
MPKIPKAAIVGTFPTHKSNRNFEWYYSGEGNRFWDVMAAVLECKFRHRENEPAKEERQAAMEKNGIVLTDMVKTCYRQDTLSQDHHLYPITLINLIDLLNNNPTIDTVVFTSRTRVIGALGLFETSLHQINMPIPEMTTQNGGMIEGWLPLGSREISLLVPYSPSKTLAEKGFVPTSRLIQMYR